MMGDHGLHSLLGAAEYRVNDVAPIRSPFVSRQLARRPGRAFDDIGLGRMNSFVETLPPPANCELFDISVVGGDSAEVRMR
jgi:hypothetical protein